MHESGRARRRAGGSVVGRCEARRRQRAQRRGDVAGGRVRQRSDGRGRARSAGPSRAGLRRRGRAAVHAGRAGRRATPAGRAARRRRRRRARSGRPNPRDTGLGGDSRPLSGAAGGRRGEPRGRHRSSRQRAVRPTRRRRSARREGPGPRWSSSSSSSGDGGSTAEQAQLRSAAGERRAAFHSRLARRCLHHEPGPFAAAGEHAGRPLRPRCPRPGCCARWPASPHP